MKYCGNLFFPNNFILNIKRYCMTDLTKENESIYSSTDSSGINEIYLNITDTYIRICWRIVT